MNKYIKYIGLSFNDYDCYNLVKLIYKEVYNKDILNTNVKHYESEKINNQYQDESLNWLKVDEAKEGDIVAIRLDSNIPKIVTHFGVMINNHQMIHTTKTTNCIIENIAKYHKLTSGIYRHKDLATG